MKYYITLLLAFNVSVLFACLNTFQFKIFPVGVFNQNICTIDFKIKRTSLIEGNEKYKLKLENLTPTDEMWVLYGFISTYDKNQKLLSCIPFDTSIAIGSSYSDTLHKKFIKGFDKIIKQNPSIELFSPEYISFCDFQQKCNLLQTKYDSINDKDFLVYENKKYLINIIRDSLYFGLGEREYLPNNISGLYVNSIRIYKSKSIKLIISHLATGHEISMGWITSNKNKKKQKDSDIIIYANEHKPKFIFTEIKNSTYEEPLLHHGYGFDVFFIK